MTWLKDFGSLRAEKAPQYFVYYGGFEGKQWGKRRRPVAKGFLRDEQLKLLNNMSLHNSTDREPIIGLF